MSTQNPSYTKGVSKFDSIIVGSGGSTVAGIRKYSATLSPASVAANTTAEQTFTVTGLLVGDTVTVNRSGASQAGLGIVGKRVTAANTLGITFGNFTASPIVPTAATVYLVIAFS